MPNLNRVMLMGNLTRDPELRFTQNNTAVAQIALAVNRRWKDQNGETKVEVTYIDAEAWGRTAEVINQYLRKGKPIFIEGRLRLDQWQDKEGNQRSKLKVVIESFEFIDSKGGGEGEHEGGGGSYNRPSVPNQQRSQQQSPRYDPPAAGPPPVNEPHQAMDDADIPF